MCGTNIAKERTMPEKVNVDLFFPYPDLSGVGYRLRLSVIDRTRCIPRPTAVAYRQRGDIVIAENLPHEMAVALTPYFEPGYVDQLVCTLVDDLLYVIARSLPRSWNPVRTFASGLSPEEQELVAHEFLFPPN
jgi:hypothetical protein